MPIPAAAYLLIGATAPPAPAPAGPGPGIAAATYLVLAGSAPAPSAIPGDLVDAVVALIEGTLVASGTLAWFGTGVAPDPPLPYAVLAEPDEDTAHIDSAGTGLVDGHLLVTAYAGTKKGARALGDRLTLLLTDAPLAFAAGTLVYLRQSSRSATLDPDPAPGGGDCWQEARMYRYLYSHRLGGS